MIVADSGIQVNDYAVPKNEEPVQTFGWEFVIYLKTPLSTLLHIAHNILVIECPRLRQEWTQDTNVWYSWPRFICRSKDAMNVSCSTPVEVDMMRKGNKSFDSSYCPFDKVDRNFKFLPVTNIWESPKFIDISSIHTPVTPLAEKQWERRKKLRTESHGQVMGWLDEAKNCT
ncbi:hypothetical protein LOAG_00052 [Loa loa]|uniref:Uncharacterized protein n=1 Tax=Loa loa TaxID=7209 RepID=A0A1S0UEC9_LOALO|nr:hypothetical protein LOAG_00052 [Loa loa]EFO28456.1 hypothetical protein LOAG_00052 [Loa loa]